MTKIGNKNVKVIKDHRNSITNVQVELTRKMTIAGKLIYAVVVTNMRNGHHYVIKTYDGLGDAFKFYKAAIA